MDDPLTKISNTLGLIQKEGGAGNLAIFIIDGEKNYYIQIKAGKGNPSLYAEAVSNEFLQTEYELNSRQMRRLEKQGWHKSDQSPNFFREWRAKDDQDRLEIARDVLETFAAVYGWKPGQDIESQVTLE